MAGPSCGGDGDRLSRAEFIEQADANCAETERLYLASDVPQSAGDFDEWVDQIKPLVQTALEELKALNPPEDLEDEWNAWIETGEDLLVLLDELREAGASEDAQRVRELLDEAQQDTRPKRLSEEMGLRDCGAMGRRE